MVEYNKSVNLMAHSSTDNVILPTISNVTGQWIMGWFEGGHLGPFDNLNPVG